MRQREVMILAHHVAEMEQRITRLERQLKGPNARNRCPAVSWREDVPPVDEVAREIQRGRGMAARSVRMEVAGTECVLGILRGPYVDDDGELVLDLQGHTGVLHGIPATSVQEVA